MNLLSMSLNTCQSTKININILLNSEGHIMKIAVLLRGQMRFSEEGSHLFQKFVMDKFPQHEFDFFISTPKRIKLITTPMTVFCSKNLSIIETEKQLAYWPNIRLWHLQNEYDLFEVIKKSINELANDKKYYDWLSQHNKKYNLNDNINDNINDFNLTPPLTGVPAGSKSIEFHYDAANILFNSISPHGLMLNDVGVMQDVLDLCDKLSDNTVIYHNSILKHYAIILHERMSQYYSFVRSYKVLKDYMKDYTDYTPDIVWSTRSDIFHIFKDDDQFDILQQQLNHLMEDKVTDKKAIISNSVLIDRNQPYVCDFNFFSTVSMLDNILKLDKQTCEDLIFDALTKHKKNLIKVADAKGATPHVLWPAVFNTACFQQSAATVHHFSSVIRYNFDSRAILKMTRSMNDETLLRKMDTDFKYPILDDAITNGDIINEFDYLSSN
jgi:hypothetical protein